MTKKKSSGKIKGTKYTTADHERAFRIWMQNPNFSEVARHDNMPSRQIIHQWSKEDHSCSCPWHGWEALGKEVHQQVLKERAAKKIDDNQLASVEDSFVKELAKFEELIKGESIKLSFLKSWAKLVMATISQSMQDETEDRAKVKAGKLKASDVRVSQFRPKNIKEAIALSNFIFTQERAIQGLPLPTEIMDRVPGAKSESNNIFNLKINNIQEDELLTLLSNSVKLADKKAEESRVNNILKFALTGDR